MLGKAILVTDERENAIFFQIKLLPLFSNVMFFWLRPSFWSKTEYYYVKRIHKSANVMFHLTNIPLKLCIMTFKESDSGVMHV